MKYIFIGDRTLLNKYVSLFPEINGYIISFIECSKSELQSNIAKYNDIDTQFIIVFDICNEIGKIPVNSQYIFDFLSDKIVNSELMPRKVRIEASTLCQLDCKGCYMRLHDYGLVGKGYLHYLDFKSFIDKHPYVREIELSNSGEIFLNPDLVRIMEYAFKHNVRLTAINGVNFNNVSQEQLEALVKYDFRYLMISIDGASNDSYKKYRRNGCYENVIHNIELLQALKDKYGRQYPKIVWQFIIMPESEDDVILAKQEAQRLNIPIWFKLTWDENYIPKKPALLARETGLKEFNRHDFLINNRKVYIGAETCSQMFLAPQINWDGRLLGCCELFTSDYGVNVFEIGLSNALKIELFIQAKKMLLGIKNDYSLYDIPCKRCYKYKQRILVNEVLYPFRSLLSD